MIYTLYHKAKPVLNFKIEEDEIVDVLNIINQKHLPVGVFKDYERGVSQKQQFRAWWRSRAIPASRQNLMEALETLGNISTEQLVTKSFGLSLSDQYWAKPFDSDLNWKDINFFENDFSDDVGKALFGTLDVQDISSLSLISPDNTSDGWLKKKWIIDDGKRVLLKGGSGEGQQEPFNEVLASAICKRLNIPHVEYSIAEHEGRYYSACMDFITTETELISAWHIRNVLKKENNVSEYQHLLNCCEKLGMKNIAEIEKQLCQMFVVDSIVANSDRHFNNFGFIRNADTLEWIGLAPVFDTGTSMFHDVALTSLRQGFADLSYKIKAKPFAKTHHEQIKKLPCAKYCKDLPLENLSDIDRTFKNILDGNELILPEKKDILCTILKDRVRETEKLIKSPELVHKRFHKNSEWER
ncbi:MAG: HipA domain-containing protein [Treponema sp.]|uniref:HipA domain-containing protein n=1 Tax=Treponema sp. TaxID=166 RepID=UPI0025EF5EAE|nr:HipA domain-containing protein [Treponema sp.]MBQ9282270.1 HipA domain-containing protein [Treponema sp.]